MKKWIGIITTCFCCSFCYGDTFLQVYQQAFDNDPTFAKARATWQAQKMNIPIARAGYLPQLSIQGNGGRNYSFYDPDTLSIINDYNWSWGYSLSLTQPLFNLSAWAAIKGSKASVKAATATYLSAEQSLMQRTANAYFAVLRARDILHYTIENKEAILKQLTASQKKYAAGLIAVIDVYDAESRYNEVSAAEINARYNLSTALENLRAITKHYYTHLNKFNLAIPLVSPTPESMDAWTKKAEAQNYEIQAQKYNVIAAMEQIKQQSGAGDPTVNLATGYNESKAVDNSNDAITTDIVNLGLNLNYNAIQGGLVLASTEQARYNYVAASAQLEVVNRQIVNQTHTSYLGIMAMIDRVKADELRVSSTKKAVIATEAGLKVGARTMVDLLDILTRQYQAEQQYTDDRYSYLNFLINLKFAAGTLSPLDIVKINEWLSKPSLVDFNKKHTLPAKKHPIKRKEKKRVIKTQKTTQNKNVKKNVQKTLKKITIETAKPKIAEKPAEKAEVKKAIFPVLETKTSDKPQQPNNISLPAPGSAAHLILNNHP